MTRNYIYGGGGGGGGKGGARKPQVHGSVLTGSNSISVVDVISEGPVEGLVNAWSETIPTGASSNPQYGEGVYFNSVRVRQGPPINVERVSEQHQRGSHSKVTSLREFISEENRAASISDNYELDNIVFANGENNQMLTDSASGANLQTAITISATREQITGGRPNGGAAHAVTTLITSDIITELVVSILFPQLIRIDRENGDSFPRTVTFKLQLLSFGESVSDETVHWERTVSVTGRSQSAYVRDFRLTNIQHLFEHAPLYVRVIRTTPDDDPESDDILGSESYVRSIVGILRDKMWYPNTAWVNIQADSDNFQQVPQRLYHLRGKKVRVPKILISDSNEYIRISNQFYDGAPPTQELVYTDNPVWCFIDLLRNERFGLGDRITDDHICWYDAWAAAKICDELVDSGRFYLLPNGDRGDPIKEPRFTISLSIQSRQDAVQWIALFVSIFRGIIKWEGGQICIGQDATTLAAGESISYPSFLFADSESSATSAGGFVFTAATDRVGGSITIPTSLATFNEDNHFTGRVAQHSFVFHATAAASITDEFNTPLSIQAGDPIHILITATANPAATAVLRYDLRFMQTADDGSPTEIVKQISRDATDTLFRNVANVTVNGISAEDGSTVVGPRATRGVGGATYNVGGNNVYRLFHIAEMLEWYYARRNAYDNIPERFGFSREIAPPTGEHTELPITMQFTNANVRNGIFTYSGVDPAARHNAISVTYRDKFNEFVDSTVYLSDAELIKRFGLKEKSVPAIGVSSRGQAERLARYILYTENYNSDTISFSASLDALANIRVGDIICVCDNFNTRSRIGGRIVDVENAQDTSYYITLDSDISINEGDTLRWTPKSGGIASSEILDKDGRRIRCRIDGDKIPQRDGIWTVPESTNAPDKLYRVIGMSRNPDSGGVDITGSLHTHAKYDYVDKAELVDEEFTNSLLTNLRSAARVPTNFSMRWQQGVPNITLTWNQRVGMSSYTIEIFPSTRSDLTDAAPLFTRSYSPTIPLNNDEATSVTNPNAYAHIAVSALNGATPVNVFLYGVRADSTKVQLASLINQAADES